MKKSLIQTVSTTKLYPGGLWYLASPYSKYPAGREQAFRDVSAIAGKLIDKGVNVFAPITHSHPIETALKGDPKPADFWLKFDEYFMKNCVGMIVACLPGWESSYGVNYELRHFAEAEKPIILLDAAQYANPVAAEPPSQAEWLKPSMQLGADETIVMKHANIKTTSPLTAEVNAKLAAMGASEAAERKAQPITSGVLDYFPDAIAEVSRISKLGNDQHNPGQPLHWERGKSTDHADCIARHLKDRGKRAPDGARHSGNLAWRALALLQEEIEAERLNAGVAPIDVYSRAHWFEGRPAKVFFTHGAIGADAKAREHVEGTMDAGIPVDHTGRSPDDRYFD